MAARDDQFWERLDAELRGSAEYETEGLDGRVGFDFARVAQGLLLKCGDDPATVDPARFEKVVFRHSEDRGLDGDEIYGQFWEAWSRVRCPVGADPVCSAAKRADGKLDLPGQYPNARFKHDAARVLQVALELSADTGDCYLPCHKLGEALEFSHMRAARILRVLTANGLLAMVGSYTRKEAQVYKPRR